MDSITGIRMRNKIYRYWKGKILTSYYKKKHHLFNYKKTQFIDNLVRNFITDYFLHFNYIL